SRPSRGCAACEPARRLADLREAVRRANLHAALRDDVAPVAEERRPVEIHVGLRAREGDLRARVPRRTGLLGEGGAQPDVHPRHVLVAADVADGAGDPDVRTETHRPHAVAVVLGLDEALDVALQGQIAAAHRLADAPLDLELDGAIREEARGL